MSTINFWSGAPTHSSFWVRARATGTSARLAVSASDDLAGAQFFGPAAIVDGVVSIEATGLQRETAYYYALEIDDVLDTTWVGRSKTLARPNTPSAVFKFVAWSCAGQDPAEYPGPTLGVSDSPVFLRVKAHNPDMIIQTGDFHYRDYGINNVALFRKAFDDILNCPNQASLLVHAPLVYTWDDHDYAANNSGASSPTRPAARQAYRDRIPHYPLPDSGGIWHSFVAGRVRFIVSDLRSERSLANAADNEAKVMMGPAQEAWFYGELDAAMRERQVICWISSVPWLGAPAANSDSWSGYNTERQRIGAHINSIGAGLHMFVISGDMHGLAIDDGRNNHWGGFPVFQMAAIDAAGSVKGGPHSHGETAGRRRYGVVRITDTGESVQVYGSGYYESDRWNSLTINIPLPPSARRVAGHQWAPGFPLRQTSSEWAGTTVRRATLSGWS